jgi:hypothetical protein
LCHDSFQALTYTRQRLAGKEPAVAHPVEPLALFMNEWHLALGTWHLANGGCAEDAGMLKDKCHSFHE